ncbi:MAG: sulfatase-like hydrolase/transferase, partial [Gammaproteobacteria bacterium]|nr:sulfatase-like hydrolase/transferase [Gammaproteobacteria bacterium]
MTNLQCSVRGLCACGLAVICSLLASCGTEKERPNILLIVLDDFGYNDLAINNGSDSPTPTLDQLAREGLRFTRHYTESSCSPSRIALLTGRYPASLGFHPLGSGLAREVETLPDVLSAHGYSSHMIGKWHAGDAHRESRPEFQGFDHWFGFMSQLYLAGPHHDGVYTRGPPTYLNPWLENENGDLRQYPGHLTELLTGHALKVMQSEKEPWFIYLSYYAPHTPLQPGVDYAGQFSDDARGKYQALKSQLDTNIARVFKQLRDSGQWDNTMVLVVSDNGGTGAAYPSNIPFAGVKAGYEEGGVR